MNTLNDRDAYLLKTFHFSLIPDTKDALVSVVQDENTKGMKRFVIDGLVAVEFKEESSKSMAENLMSWKSLDREESVKRLFAEQYGFKDRIWWNSLDEDMRARAISEEGEVLSLLFGEPNPTSPRFVEIEFAGEFSGSVLAEGINQISNSTASQLAIKPSTSYYATAFDSGSISPNSTGYRSEYFEVKQLEEFPRTIAINNTTACHPPLATQLMSSCSLVSFSLDTEGRLELCFVDASPPSNRKQISFSKVKELRFHRGLDSKMPFLLSKVGFHPVSQVCRASNAASDEWCLVAKGNVYLKVVGSVF